MHTDELNLNDRRIEYGFVSPLDAPRAVNYLHEEARVWLPTILDRLTIRRPVLLGHSDGASISPRSESVNIDMFERILGQYDRSLMTPIESAEI
jgi:hypothetical protein